MTDISKSEGCNQDSMSAKFLDIERRMCVELRKIIFASPVVYVYNPLEHASEIHENFITKYLNGPKKVMLFGMNPGPWGMSQTGVPFGHVGYVRDWLKLTGNVTKPIKEHPKRPIEGLNCARSEVSGERLWGLLKELCVEPDRLFTNVFLHNYCPLAFLSESGKNITPPELKANVRQHLQEVCDAALIDVVVLLEVEHLIAVGKYATDRAKAALKNKGLTDIKGKGIRIERHQLAEVDSFSCNDTSHAQCPEPQTNIHFLSLDHDIIFLTLFTFTCLGQFNLVGVLIGVYMISMLWNPH
ncbi:single-strand-selective monofunctional uracil-DNA glycosylase isoform X2 [Oratosquilla oratoria]